MYRNILIERLAECDDYIMDKFLNETEISIDDIHKSIRKCVLERTFIPVYMGSAYKNKGVQLVLNAVCRYLPNPTEVINNAYEKVNGEENKIVLNTKNTKSPFVG